jgi:hypothetical protein
MKILQTGAEFFLADGRTDRHDQLTVVFRHFATAPKSVLEQFIANRMAF